MFIIAIHLWFYLIIQLSLSLMYEYKKGKSNWKGLSQSPRAQVMFSNYLFSLTKNPKPKGISFTGI